MTVLQNNLVIPAQAGIPCSRAPHMRHEAPACAGVTTRLPHEAPAFAGVTGGF